MSTRPTFSDRKAARRERNRRYRAAHHEKVLAIDRRYRASNHETVLERNRRYLAGNLEKERERKHRYRIENPDRRREASLRHRLKPYGLGPEDFQRLLAEQNNVCAICGGGARRLVLDHDHRTGRVRGILCCVCNLALGSFGDSEEVLVRAAGYLRAFQPKPAEVD